MEPIRSVFCIAVPKGTIHQGELQGYLFIL